MKTVLKIYIIPFLLILSGFISCDLESEIEIDDYAISSRLVMNGIITVDKDTSSLYFSNSKAIFGKENSREVIQGFSGNQSYWYLDPKVYLLPNVETSIYKNNTQQTNIYINPNDDITYYVDQVRAGDQIRIEAIENGRKISSTTTIPSKPEILGIDTMSFFNYSSSTYSPYYSNKYLRLSIKIKDQPDLKNYYRIFVDTNTEIHIDPEYANYHDLPEVLTNVYSWLDTEDPAITNGNPKNDNNPNFSIIEFQQNIMNIFNDDLFTGGEYTLSVFTIYADFTNSERYFYSYTTPYSDIPEKYVLYEKVKVSIRLQALSEDLYKYYASLQKFIYYNEDLIEPIRVYGNINSGLGILGSINQLSRTVYEMERSK